MRMRIPAPRRSGAGPRSARRAIVGLALVVACTLGSAVAASAQTNEDEAARPRSLDLAGRVTDGAGRPIAQVSVGVAELRRGADTDEQGRYTIPALPPGVYHVSFQRLGYAPSVRRFELSAARNVLDMTLVESLVEVQGTQVTASARATTPLTSPQPTSVLGGEALRLAQAATLGGTIEQLPGVRSWSTGSGVGKPTIRGLRSDRVVIAANEQRLDQQQWGDEHGPQIETSDIEKIEVIRGPASVLYGSDALGGVVNVITRPLPVAYGRTPFATARMFGGYGSVDARREGGLSLEGASGGLGFRGSLSGRRSDDVSTPGGDLPNSGGAATHGSLALGLRGAGGSLDLAYTGRVERIELPEDPAEDPGATPEQRIRDDQVRLAAILPLGEQTRLEVSLGAERNRRREFEAAGDPEVALGLLAKSGGAVARLHHPAVGRFEGLLGLSYRAQRFEKFGAESLIPESRGRDLAAFAFEQAEFGRWRLAVGARVDHRSLDVEDDADLGVAAQERSWSAVSGNLGALYRVAEPVALVANLGRGFRAPSNYDLFANGVHEGTASFEQGNPGLGVETSWNGDLALRVQTARLEGEAGAFLNEIEDFIYTRPTGTFDPGSGHEIFETVQGNARLVGFEVSADLHPDRRLHLSLGSDFVRGDNRESGVPLPWIPPLRALYGARYEPGPVAGLTDVYLGVRGESVARQGRLDPRDTSVPASSVAHLEAGGTLPLGGREVAIDLQVRNVFDRAYRDFMSRFKAWADAPGRSLTLRVTTAF